MICKICGAEFEGSTDVCPLCTDSQPTNINQAANKINLALKDGLFLTICVLISISTLFSVIIGGLPIINILLTIFLWLAFYHSKSNLNSTHIRSISGTVFAYYILLYVIAGVLIFTGTFYSMVLKTMFELSASFPELAELTTYYREILKYNEEFMPIINTIIAFIMFLIAAGIILINIFGIRKIHKFIKSVYQNSDKNNNNFLYAASASSWLFVIGGLNIFISLTTFRSIGLISTLSTLSSISYGVALIFAGVIINKYFVD